ncbi:MAG: TlpA disulfide reductase family protein [Caldilineaceae bacterium]
MMNTTMQPETTINPMTASKSPLLKRLLVIAGIALAGFLLLFATSAFLAMVVWNGLDAGQPAPDFRSQDLNGNPVHLTDYAGKPVMLTFWSPDCSACREELPTLQAIATDANADVTLLTVVSKMPTAEVQQFMTEAGLTFPVIIDEAGAIATDYEITGVPVSYFINPDGVIDHNTVGAGREGELANNLLAWLRTCNLDEVCK